MKLPTPLLLAFLALAADLPAQTSGAPAPASATPRTKDAAGRASPVRTSGRSGGAVPPDPDLFDGSKLEAEKRPEYGMLGDFEMPGSDNSQESKVGGQPSQQGGGQQDPNQSQSAANSGGSPAAAANTSGAQQQQAAAAGGAAGAENAENGAGGAGGDQNSAAGGAGAPGGTSKTGGSGPAGQAVGIAADSLSGGASAASQDSVQQKAQRAAATRIGSAELRIETYPDANKDIVGREAAPGGTQGSNRAMPEGKGGQGSNNQNMGVEKGKVIPKGL